MARNYSNIALDTTLTAGIAAGDLSFVVASASGWPAAPFAAVLDPGLVTEEVVQVTAKVGTTFTATRGFDGTTAAAHALGAVVRHSAIAGDFTDLQAADAAEASARAAADTTNATAISSEATTRGNADTTLQTNITNEASTRAADDATLSSAISAEASARAAADTTLQTNINGKQPIDGTLTALAALVIAADKIMYGTGADAFALADFTAAARTFAAATDATGQRGALGLGGLAVLSAITASLISDASADGRSLITAANYAAMKTLLQLVVGTDVQAFDADLAAIAALAGTGVAQRTGANAWAVAALLAADIPNLDAAKIATGTMATARLGSGTADGTTFLRGDQTYAVPSGGGGAPTTATYITQTTDAGLSAEQALSSLATGYVKNTTGTGVLSVQAPPIPIADGGTGSSSVNANTALLGPTSGAAAAPTQRAFVNQDMPDPARYIRIFEDFAGNAQGSIGTSSTGTGAAVTFNGTGEAGHPGIAVIAGSGAGATAGLGSSNTGVANVLLGGGAWVYQSEIRVPVVSDGTDTFLDYFGFSDDRAGTGTDAVYFRYTHSANSGKFECVTRSNGVETAADSGITLVAATWYTLRIEINAAASSVAFYIDGALVATNTTNIPSGAGRETAMMTYQRKTAGSTLRNLEADYVSYTCDLTTAR